MKRMIDRRSILRAGGAGLLAVGGAGLARPAIAAGKTTASRCRIRTSATSGGSRWRTCSRRRCRWSRSSPRWKGPGTTPATTPASSPSSSRNLISQRVDAIVVNAASPTALNGILNQAAARGILVVSFDNVVTTPKGIEGQHRPVRIRPPDGRVARAEAGRQGQRHHGHRRRRHLCRPGPQQGRRKRLGQEPGIKVVARFTGMWDSSVAERNTSAVLPSLPKIDGIWCQGGTDGVLKAFIAAKPHAAADRRRGRERLSQVHDRLHGPQGRGHLDRPAAVPLGGRRSSSPAAVLQGSYPSKDITIPFPCVTNDTVKVGETVFPDLPDSFFDDFTDSGRNAVVKLCSGAALDGKPCSGHARGRPAQGMIESPQRIGGRSAAPAVEGQPAGRSRSAACARSIEASFGAAAGEVHALVGENGAGKSTMIKVLGGRLRAGFRHGPHQGPRGRALRPAGRARARRLDGVPGAHAAALDDRRREPAARARAARVARR